MIYILLAWFLWYPILVASKWGVLSSISASSYRWQGNQKAWFIGWLVVLAGLSYFLPLGDWVLGMVLGFCISGMSPDHKQDPNSVEDFFHSVGTIGAIASGFLGLIFMHTIYIPAAVFVVGGFLLWKFAFNWIWWVEILAALMMVMGLLMI